MKIVRKIRQRAKDIAGAWSVAGATNVWPVALRPHIGTKKTLEHRQDVKLRTVMRVLSEKYATTISGTAYADKESAKGYQPEKAPIWVFWQQGLESMPPICRVCYEQLCKKASGHPVRLVTAENMKQYIQLPAHVVRKTREGKITPTHLSDIVRMSLLAGHGGLWLDATVYVSQPIPEEAFGPRLFTTATHTRNTGNVSHSRWAGFILGGRPGHELFRFGRDFLFEYWRRENRLIDYFLIDFVIALAYERLPQVAAEIDSLPTCRQGVRGMQEMLCEEYNGAALRELIHMQTFHKLSYKQTLVPATPQAETTLYGFLLRLMDEQREDESETTR